MFKGWILEDVTVGKHFLVQEEKSTLRWAQNAVGVYIYTWTMSEPPKEIEAEERNRIY